MVRERCEEITREGEHLFVDVVGEFRARLVGHGAHFHLGVEVIDVVEGEGFWGLWDDGGAKVELSVVAGNQVEKVNPHVFIRWGEMLPI